MPTVVEDVTRSQTNRCVAILASKPQVERKTLSTPGYSEDCKSLARSLEQGIQGRQIARKQSLHVRWFSVRASTFAGRHLCDWSRMQTDSSKKVRNSSSSCKVSFQISRLLLVVIGFAFIPTVYPEYLKEKSKNNTLCGFVRTLPARGDEEVQVHNPLPNVVSYPFSSSAAVIP